MIYKPPSTCTSVALREYTSHAYLTYSLHDVMSAWHWYIPKIYSKKANIDIVADLFDTLQDDISPFEVPDHLSTQPGIQTEIPKCVKAISLRHAIDICKGSQSIISEVKYDGERMQIHILSPDPGQIKIFSKSKRDSTKDRESTIPIIREALSLRHESRPRSFPNDEIENSLKNAKKSKLNLLSNAIFEAEMVAFDRKRNKIDEFFRIRQLLGSNDGIYGIHNKLVFSITQFF